MRLFLVSDLGVSFSIEYRWYWPWFIVNKPIEYNLRDVPRSSYAEDYDKLYKMSTNDDNVDHEDSRPYL